MAQPVGMTKKKNFKKELKTETERACSVTNVPCGWVMRGVVRPSRRMRKAGGGGVGPNAPNRAGVLGQFGAKNQNGAAGARLWRTKHGGAFFQVGGTLLERGTLG